MGRVTLLGDWTVQPLALASGLAGLFWYLPAARRQPRWGRARPTLFVLGVLAWWWTTCGWVAVAARSLFWAWTTQHLLLLLVVPVMILAGQPVTLARRTGHQLRIPRLLSSPLIGPALVPLASAALFFGLVPGWSVATPLSGWLIQLVVLAIGGAIALPLVDAQDSTSSLAVGLALAIGVLELVIDAIPGIVLRLQTHLSSTFFAHRPHVADLSPLRDQQRAGAILWVVAEILDVPFVILVFRRWIRADARDAAQIDVVLDAEQAASGQEEKPWWLSDPGLRDRFRD